ncbi:MAG: glycosyltransferase family 2 protein [Gemmatimonadota bacterium]
MVYFLIPAYNEEATVGLLLYKIRQVMRNVRRDYLAIVLDDGSTDATSDVAEQYRRFLPVKVLRHAENRGLAPSLDRLVREAVRLSQYPERDVAIVLEADFTWSPAAVPDMVHQVEAGSDIVIGARTHPDSKVHGVSRAKRLTTRVVEGVLRAVMPLRNVTDYGSTYRAYRIGMLKRAVSAYQENLITTRDAAANVELLLRLGRFHPAIVEVPVDYREDTRSRPSRHRWTMAIRSQLALTGRVERVAAP